ncbi:hypothetical protein GVAMD_0203 [Gardnerella vaginalis AMD]|nr:hypothetical protein GVAMD_0203 [Gardnerella vaginalis AMD]
MLQSIMNKVYKVLLISLVAMNVTSLHKYVNAYFLCRNRF